MKSYEEWRKDPLNAEKSWEDWTLEKEKEELYPGKVLCDMHGSSLAALLGGRPNTYQRGFNEKYEIRNALEWVDRSEWIDAGMEHLTQYLSHVCRKAHQFYTNKYLVVVDEALSGRDEGWWVAMYVYDGRRAGMCEVRLRKEVK